jgi:hypothetical protein
VLRAAALCAALVAASPAAAQELQSFEGAVHEHTAYSDGEPGTRPADAFAAVRARGGDFMALTEHSDTFELPIVTNLKCFQPAVLPLCLLSDQVQPLNSFRKWAAMAEQTNAATDAGFVGIRGFEWTNDRHGHINVLFSSRYTNAKVDLGYLSMDFFWRWFTKPPSLGGGADGLGTFNHPSRRTIGDILPGGLLGFLPPAEQPGTQWDDFRHVPAADRRMVGMELFNGGADYGVSNGRHPAGAYGQALDRGWHVGAIGAEDTHDRSWGNPADRKTVVLAPALTRPALREAMLARRFYAVRESGTRLRFSGDGQPMGARLARAAGTPVTLAAGTDAPGATLELVSSRGAVVAQSAGSLSVTRPASPAERWYFVRVRDAAGRSIAYSSPVWVEVG